VSQLTAEINPVTGPVWVEGIDARRRSGVTIHGSSSRTVAGWSVSIPGSPVPYGMSWGAEMFTRQIPIDAGSVHVTRTGTYSLHFP
jgi:amidase